MKKATAVRKTSTKDRPPDPGQNRGATAREDRIYQDSDRVRPKAKVTARASLTHRGSMAHIGATPQPSARKTVVPLAAHTPREIPREEWQAFLDDFSTRRDNWLTEIEVAPLGETGRIEARELPLDGVSADLKADESTTSVILGKDPADHITHLIPRTARITLTSESALEIEAVDGTRTIVRCRRPKEG